jgi:C-terminal processing protease CtpA/Prc
VVVGERSYGKFLIQTVTQHKTRFGPALLKRTCAIYETPAGHFYPRRSREEWFIPDPMGGIPPDVLVPMEDAEAKILKEIFEHEALSDWNPDLGPVHPDFVDPHIDAALRVLRGEAVAARIPVVAKAG